MLYCGIYSQAEVSSVEQGEMLSSQCLVFSVHCSLFRQQITFDYVNTMICKQFSIDQLLRELCAVCQGVERFDRRKKKKIHVKKMFYVKLNMHRTFQTVEWLLFPFFMLRIFFFSLVILCIVLNPPYCKGYNAARNIRK